MNTLDEDALNRHLQTQLNRDAALGVPIAALGCALIYGVLALAQPWIGAPGSTPAMTGTMIGVTLYSMALWLALKRWPATEGNAHPLLLSLCLAMCVNNGFHQYVLGGAVHTTNPILTALACAYFFSARPWLLTALAIVISSWLPAALANGPFSADWRHWTAIFISGMFLALAAFEARRRTLLRVESLRQLAEQRKAEAETALAQVSAATADRLAMERAMHEAQRRESLGFLAGGIAHDFNNLLTVIQGNVDLARLLLGPESKLHRRLATIEDATERATRLTQQLLVYSGKANPRMEHVDLGERVRLAARLLESVVGARIELKLHEAPERLVVAADAALLDQVILNLLQNAIEACAGGGRIDVRWGLASPTQAFLIITDTGCGMDQTTRDHMFDPFFTTKPTGTGLGLAAVKGIADSHQATIDVSSELNHGSTILLRFPLSEDRLSAPTMPFPAPPARGLAPALEAPVLVIDDQDGVRQVARGYLEAAGYRVLEAASGNSALAMIREQPRIGAALIDLTMPGMSGYEVAMALREQLPTLPMVIMSGFDRDDALGDRSDSLALPFLQKPFNAAELNEALFQAVPPNGGDSRQAASHR